LCHQPARNTAAEARNIMPKVRLNIKHASGQTQGVDIEVHPEWAPLGAARFLDLVDDRYFDECRLYRMVPDFIVQWGIPSKPELWNKWGMNKIQDDPVSKTNAAGTLSFATSGPDARGSQIFVNFVDNGSMLDGQGFAPFAELCDKKKGLAFLSACNEIKGIDQAAFKQAGNQYLEKHNFKADLSYIESAERI